MPKAKKKDEGKKPAEDKKGKDGKKPSEGGEHGSVTVTPKS